MKQWLNKLLHSENGASKTNKRIVIVVVVGLVFIIGMFFREVNSRDVTKPKGTEQLLQGATSDVGNQNLAEEFRSFVQQYNTDKMRQQDARKAGGMDEEVVKRMINEAVGSRGAETRPDDDPFGNSQTNMNPPLNDTQPTSFDGQASTTKENTEQPRFGSDEASQSKKNSGLSTTKGARGTGAGKSRENQSYLPPGSVLSYIALTGVNAPTNINSDAKNPPVVLLAIKGSAILPNGYTSDLGECFVIGPVFGQFMDSRAVARPKTISCVRDDGKAVEAQIVGEILGEDGKPGWHGKTVSKTGKVMAGLARIGVMETISNTLTGIGNGFNINVGGGSSDGTARTQINLGSTAAQGAAKATSSAFDKMASIYEKYGNEAIPVIEVEPLRTGEIILTEGLTLDFVKEVK